VWRGLRPWRWHYSRRQFPLRPADLEPVVVEGQPLAANVNRLLESLTMLGARLPKETVDRLAQAGKQRDGAALQKLLDAHVLFVVSLNPESRVKVDRGPAPAVLQQAGYTPVIVKIVNQSTVTKRLGSAARSPVRSTRASPNCL